MKKGILVSLIAMLSVSVIVIWFISKKRTPTIRITPNQAKHGDLIRIEAFNFPPNVALYGISADTPSEGELIGTTDNSGYLTIQLILGVAAPIGSNLITVTDRNGHSAYAYLEVLGPTIKITPNQAKHGDLIRIEAFNFPPNIVLYGISSNTPPEGDVIGTTSNNGYLAIELVLGVAAPIGQNLIRVVGYILQDSNIVVYEAHAYLEVLE